MLSVASILASEGLADSLKNSRGDFQQSLQLMEIEKRATNHRVDLIGR
jgi:hypothetical protein